MVTILSMVCLEDAYNRYCGNLSFTIIGEVAEDEDAERHDYKVLTIVDNEGTVLTVSRLDSYDWHIRENSDYAGDHGGYSILDPLFEAAYERDQYKLNAVVAAMEEKSNQQVVFDDNDKHTNERGGQQTKLPVRMDLIPSGALLEVAQVLSEGAEKYGENNWMNIDTNDHLNHALTHIFRFLGGDDSEPHLSHAICRLLFAHYTSTASAGEHTTNQTQS